MTSLLPARSPIVAKAFAARTGSGFRSCSSVKNRIVAALGGNALLQRHQDLTIENQRRNIENGSKALGNLIENHNLVIVHGNGPQAGRLVLESHAYERKTALKHTPLDVIDAETEGQIGYLLEQELQQYIEPNRGMATILSQILVDPNDPAFSNPTKFLGPVYTKEEATHLSFPVKQDGKFFRRVVPSPFPIKMLDHEMRALRLLTDSGCVVICAGGGGIPVVKDLNGKMHGVEAVIDKDRAATMVGVELQAEGLLILTDVEAAATDFGTPNEKRIRAASPNKLQGLKDHFPSGSMGPKIESAIEFVNKTGGWAAIGSLDKADKVVERAAGTIVERRGDTEFIEFYNDLASSSREATLQS